MEDISFVLSGIERAISNQVDGGPALADLDSDWFGEQVVASRSDPAEMAKWASSPVIDVNVKAPVFDERVFSWLHRGLSDGLAFPIGHAGLMHVYGYLLSSVETPYGLKRKRWLTADLANAFGLESSVLLSACILVAADGTCCVSGVTDFDRTDCRQSDCSCLRRLH